MKVIVKAKVRRETAKAALFVSGNSEFWLPHSAYEHLQGNRIVTSQRWAEDKGVEFMPFIHVPEPIDPVYDQEAIDDLLY